MKIHEQIGTDLSHLAVREKNYCSHQSSYYDHSRTFRCLITFKKRAGSVGVYMRRWDYSVTEISVTGRKAFDMTMPTELQSTSSLKKKQAQDC